jgi:hypothetical protein
MSDQGKNAWGRFIESGMHWPVMLVLLFMTSASFVITTAFLGAGTGSRMIEPDYYARAVDWDATKERLDAAKTLGWSFEPGISPDLDGSGSRLVSLHLTDEYGEPIEDAQVDLILFAHTEAHERTETGLAHSGAGMYQSRVKGMGTRGLWELRVLVTRGETEALVIESIEIKD